MSFNEYLDRHNEWRRYLNGKLISTQFSIPDKEEWAEKIFSQQPKTHQAKYAEDHEEVETDVNKLQQFFNGCHTRDVSYGTLAKVLKKARDSRRARLARERGEVNSNCRDRKVERRRSINDSDKRTTDRYN